MYSWLGAAPIECADVVFGALFYGLILSAHFSFAIILLRKRGLVVLLQLCSCVRVAVCVLCLFLVMARIVLWSVIKTSPVHFLIGRLLPGPRNVI